MTASFQGVNSLPTLKSCNESIPGGGGVDGITKTLQAGRNTCTGMSARLRRDPPALPPL